MTTSESNGSLASDYFFERRGGSLPFGIALASIRRLEHKTQIAFARKLGISTAHLCDIEKGRRFVSAQRAAQFAKKMKLPPSFWIKLALQDQLDQTGLKFKVEVTAA